MKTPQFNSLSTLCFLGLFVTFLLATRTAESENWAEKLVKKIQRNKCGKPAYLEGWRAEIKSLKARMSPDDLKRMSLLVSCVDLKSPICNLNEIYKSIPEANLVSSLAKLLRFEMAIVYAFEGAVSQTESIQRLLLKVVEPCKQVHESVSKWWKRLKRRNVLTRSQLEWLRLETICTGIISGVGDGSSGTLAKAIQSKLWEQNEVNYKQQIADPSWFSERIPEALEPTIAARSGQVLRLMVNSVSKECESDLDRENLHKALPSGVLSKALAKLALETTKSGRFERSKLTQRAQAACEYVHLVLQRWWQDNYQRKDLTKLDLEWLRIENICQNIRASLTTSEPNAQEQTGHQTPEGEENLEFDCWS